MASPRAHPILRAPASLAFAILLGTVSVAALAPVSPAAAQTVRSAVLDTDDDGQLERAEFIDAFGPDALVRFDRDGDDALDEGEFGAGLFRLWDDDGSGALSIDEWDDGVDRWFGEDPVNLEVNEWDRDGDGTITPAEFEAELGTTALFGALDVGGDGRLDIAEFGGGVFDTADRDRDAVADDDEDGFFTNLAEAVFTTEADPFAPDAAERTDAEPDGDDMSIDPLADDPFADDAPLIERGEPFTSLPVPCGEDGCEATAAAFCKALGYEPPLGILDVQDALHVIRCADEL